MPTKPLSNKEDGFSLLELMVVIVITVILSAIFISQYGMRKNEAGGGERLLTEFADRVNERRTDALRLGGEDNRAAGYVNFDVAVNKQAKPLAIDFASLPTTASLFIGGNDPDGDCRDNDTNQTITCVVSNIQGRNWSYGYRDNPLSLPTGWQLATSTADLGTIPLIFAGANGRGILATKIGFMPDGKARAANSADVFKVWPAGVGGTNYYAEPSLPLAPFWAIYFVFKGKGSDGRTAVALAIHPSGVVERFRFDGTSWLGLSNRIGQ